MKPLTEEKNTTDLQSVFETMPGNSVLLLPDAPRFTIVSVTEGYLQSTQQARHELTGKGIFEAFPGNPEDPEFVGEKTVRASLEYVLSHKEPHQLPIQRYDIPAAGGGFEERYWAANNKPVLGENGKVIYLIHTADDVTETMKEEQRQTRIRNIERSYNLFMQAPVMIGISRGEQNIIELANKGILDLWGRTPDIIGKPLLEAMPELEGQGFVELINFVRNTGRPFHAHEVPASFVRDGRDEVRYLNFTYQPYYEETDNKPAGVFCVAHDVTEQVLARKKAAESEHRFQDLVSEATVATAIYVGREMRIQYANEAMFRLWGKDPSVIGKTILEALPEIEGQSFRAKLDHVFTTGETYWGKGERGEIVVDGKLQTFYFNFSYKALRNSSGEIYGILNMANDVTEQVDVRQRIEASEQRFRALVESAPFPIAVYAGAEFRIELANQSIIDTWGKGDGVIGKLYREVLPELGNQKVFAQIEGVYRTGRAFHARNERVDLVVDGKLQPYYFNYSFTPLFDASGNVYGVMNTGADVTDLNVAKQRVEQSEKNFRNMILQAPVAMCILMGPEHVVDIANEAMIGLWGKPAEAVMNKPIFEGLPDAREQGLEQLLHDVYHTGVSFHADERAVELVRNGRKETVYQNFGYEPYRDSEGNILGVLAISIDVTEQVHSRQKIEEIVVQRTRELADANEALLRSNQELKRTNTNLEEFAYAASHDMKEPVRKIHFFSDLLKTQLEDRLNDQQRNLFGKLENAARRMHTLIDDLLSYSQATRGVSDLEEINLNRLVKNVLDDLELELDQKNASVTLDRLPTIMGDSRQFQQLFQNLVSNALKYSKQAVHPEVKILYREVKGKEVRPQLSGDDGERLYHFIEVKDNGIGFEQKDAERIFNVFTRLHQDNAEYRGTGVGLSIVSKVMDNHNGIVWAESEPGEGACFKLLLPVE
jgi:PAS domain S-box-containing protein